MERNLQLQCLLPFEQRLGVKVQRCVIFRSFHGRHKATNLDACGIRITSYSPPKNTIQNLSFAALLVLQCEDLEINRTHSAEYRTSHSMKWSLTARMFHSNSHSVFANRCRFEKESCLCLQTQTQRVCFQTELHLLTCGPQNDLIMCDYPPTVTYNNELHLGMFCFTVCLKVMVWCAFSAFVLLRATYDYLVKSYLKAGDHEEALKSRPQLEGKQVITLKSKAWMFARLQKP